MNVLQKSTLTVSVVTMVASILILLTGQSVADNVKKVAPVTPFVDKSSVTGSIAPIINSDSSKKSALKEKEVRISSSVMPPPGPFQRISPKNEGDQSTKIEQKMLEQVSPKKPVLSTNLLGKPATPPSKPKAPEKNINKPSRVVKSPVPPSVQKIAKPATLTDKKQITKAPEFKRVRPSIPVDMVEIPQKPHIQKGKPQKPKGVSHTIISQPVNNRALPQKMVKPEIKSKPHLVEPSPVNVRLEPPMPINNRKPSAKPMMPQMRGMSGSAGQQQQYIYVPMPMYQPNFVYPQFPINGRGYNQRPPLQPWYQQPAGPGNSSVMYPSTTFKKDRVK